MKRTPLKRGTKPMKRSRIKHKPRKASEFLRIYGGQGRAKTMRMRPCDHCGHRPTEDFQNENAHTENGGMGRKAGWETVVTLCKACHRALHWLGSCAEFLRVTGTDLRAIAARLALEIPARGTS